MKLFPIFFLGFLGFAQTTYKSQASEYIFQDSPSSIAEMMDRDIIISKNNIVIKSYGSKGIDIQTWRIQSQEKIVDNHSAITVYYAELASGEEYEFPATFYMRYGENDNVDTIICEIPRTKYLNLPKDAPVSIRFIID